MVNSKHLKEVSIGSRLSASLKHPWCSTCPINTRVPWPSSSSSCFTSPWTEIHPMATMRVTLKTSRASRGIPYIPWYTQFSSSIILQSSIYWGARFIVFWCGLTRTISKPVDGGVKICILPAFNTHGSRPWEVSGKPMRRANHVHYQKSGRDLRSPSPEWLITGCWTALVLKSRERDKLFTRDFRELDKLLYDLIWNARDRAWDLKQEPQKKSVWKTGIFTKYRMFLASLCWITKQ